MEKTSAAWIKLLRSALPDLGGRYHVTRLWLFGPHMRGKGGPGIPLDILADIEGQLSYGDFLELQDALSRLLGVKVELVLKGSLDPSIAEIIIPEMIPVA